MSLSGKIPWWPSGKESTRQCRRRGIDPWVWKVPRRRVRQPSPVFLPGKSHGQRGLVGYSPWGPKQSDTTEKLRTSSKTHLGSCKKTSRSKIIKPPLPPKTLLAGSFLITDFSPLTALKADKIQNTCTSAFAFKTPHSGGTAVLPV